MKVKEEREKVGVKLNIHKTKIMVSGPITSCQIEGEAMEQWETLSFWAPQSLQMMTAAMKVRRGLFLERKVMTNLDSILKSRDITLPTKVKAMFFPVVMNGCKNWTIKKAECQRIDAFWTVVLKKTPESPLDCKEIQPVHPKGNQSWIFTGRTDAEAETPSFGHLLRRTDSLEKTWCWETLKAGGEGDDRGWDGWMASPTQWTWIWVSSGSWWHAAVHGVTKSWTWLNNLSETSF